jgi:hypothetical protein
MFQRCGIKVDISIRPQQPAKMIFNYPPVL